MKLSFKDYTLISDAFAEAQLDEGKIWDAIKAKLGGKASDAEVEAELERLKKTDKASLAKIKDTAASRDFHKRKAQQHAAAAAKKPEPTRGTLGTPKGAQTNDVWDSALSADDRKFISKRDRMAEGKAEDNAEWQEGYKYAKAVRAGKAKEDLNGVSTAFKQGYRTGMNESLQLDEAQIEFDVEYTSKGGGSSKKTIIKGIDVTAVKEKFRRQYAGWRFLSAKPRKAKPKA